MTSRALASVRAYLLLAIAAAAIAGVALLEPIPQDGAYHQFADIRTRFTIPNFWNVTSNLPLVIAGAAGLVFLQDRGRGGVLSALRPAYTVFFAGVLATGFGSAWYHLAPDNRTLIWDRLPMTLAFMGLFTIVIGEHVAVLWARRLLLPLLIAGAVSVLYWAVTESYGIGDLRPYALVQFLPMIMIPLILLMYRSHFDRTAFIWWVIAVYAVSKVLEFYDQPVFALTGFVSGHTLKHVVVAVAPLVLMFGFARRRPR